MPMYCSVSLLYLTSPENGDDGLQFVSYRVSVYIMLLPLLHNTV